MPSPSVASTNRQFTRLSTQLRSDVVARLHAQVREMERLYYAMFVTASLKAEAPCQLSLPFPEPIGQVLSVNPLTQVARIGL